ncbi:MAG TPA: hypothetical protein VFJ43_11040, partial [Bacteroidia bacterium]|nr:hypothetical protein [Bacteroidia bacterium]
LIFFLLGVEIALFMNPLIKGRTQFPKKISVRIMYLQFTPELNNFSLTGPSLSKCKSVIHQKHPFCQTGQYFKFNICQSPIPAFKNLIGNWHLTN